MIYYKSSAQARAAMAVVLLAVVCSVLAFGTTPARANVPSGSPTFSNPLNITNPYIRFSQAG